MAEQNSLPVSFDALRCFQQTFGGSADPVWLIRDRRFVDCNQAAVLALGYRSREELLNVHPARLSPAVQEDGQSSLLKAERMMHQAEEQGVLCFEWIHQRADGQRFLAEVSLFRVEQMGERTLLCTWRDLSASRLRDQQLQTLLEEQRLIFDSAHVGILMLRHRRILRCNHRFAEMFGYAMPEELVGFSTSRFYPSAEAFARIGAEGYASLAENGSTSFECEMTRADGESIWVIQSGRALAPEDVLGGISVWVYTDVTRFKQVDRQARRLEEKFTRAFDCCPLAAAISNISDGRFLEVNSSYERNFGWTRADLIGRTSLEVGFWPDSATRDAWLQAIYRAGRLVNYETIWIHKSGERRHVSLSCEIIELDGESWILTYMTDITARKLWEADLRIAATAFESQEPTLVTDANGVILRVNQAYIDNTGYSAAELVGKTPAVLRSGRHEPAFYAAMWRQIMRDGSWRGEVWDRRKNGEIYPKWLTISAVKDEQGTVTHYVGVHHDITERKAAEERINALAFYDQLTGLPNRTLLRDRLQQAMAGSERDASYGALLFIDLDNFKTLNDTQGHEQGDQLLKIVAGRLREVIRETDTAARQGGDEFVVVISGLGDETVAALAAEHVAEKLLAVLAQPYVLGTLVHRSSASIGVTLFLGPCFSSDELMKQADLAMYKAKAAGRNVVRFFDPAMEAAVHVRANLERDLRTALDEGQFLLHFQPQVRSDASISGAEILLRWQHPSRGMVSPADFIPLAEETDLIVPIGYWVIESACCLLVEWAANSAWQHLTLAVNVSARQFDQPDFVERVLGIIERSGAPARRLKLELTESIMAGDVDAIIGKMRRLGAVGVGFSLDDFGTGYSSLSYLKLLPLDQLKIDQSFVRDVLTDANDAAIARTVVALAGSLGLEVIAEGVETAEQRDFLAASGCYNYQGYFFSRPLPLAAFRDFLPSRLAVAEAVGV
ncbi:EAL domain-containing protein [Dechloromonas sp. ZY10]|uniref:EAL domain-containing protein n=1 Tax=Dechloromonas aquae TaxID=2664436 RepID=UPI0035286BA2